MIIAGLTGGIATGKSTVSAIFQKAGAFVIDADQISHRVISQGLPAWQQIRSLFGDKVLDADGAINRAVLGQIVFNDRKRRKQLEGIVHPEVRSHINQEVRRLRRTDPQSVVIQDIPLLLETGMTQGLDEIIVVYTPAAVQLDRLMLRDGIDMDAALARIKAQMPIEDKRLQATLIIDNSGDYAATEKQTIEIYDNLVQRAGGNERRRGSNT